MEDTFPCAVQDKSYGETGRTIGVVYIPSLRCSARTECDGSSHGVASVVRPFSQQLYPKYLLLRKNRGRWFKTWLGFGSQDFLATATAIPCRQFGAFTCIPGLFMLGDLRRHGARYVDDRRWRQFA